MLAGKVLTIVDSDGAAPLGVRTSIGQEDASETNTTQTLRFDVLGEFAQYAAEGRFAVPIARTFALENWRTALAISQSGHAGGKLLLLPRESS